MAQENQLDGISKTLRTVTDAEKIQFYIGQGHSASQHIHIEADGTKREWTQDEWEDHILEHMPHPDFYIVYLSYIGKRRELYPDQDEQLDALWKMVKHLKDNGTDIGTDAQAILDTISTAKLQYPKPAATS